MAKTHNLPTPAKSDDLKDGLSACDYAKTLQNFKLRAKQEYAHAQFNLGMMYANGQGVAQDDKAAAKWYRLAAEQGDSKAQSNLGVMYDHGQGVAQDYQEAMKWYRLAAEQGGSYAQYNLGVMYAEGRGVPQDSKEALKWFGLAAEQGEADAQNMIGRMYFHGEGVPQDRLEGYKWLRLASAQGRAHETICAQKNGRMENIATTAQIAELKKLIAGLAENTGLLMEDLPGWFLELSEEDQDVVTGAAIELGFDYRTLII